ncbi:MAG: hypothetical protein ACM31C_10275, partial [Acidobacteriota bacterium]
MMTLRRAVHGIGVVIVRRTWLVAVVTVIACAAFSARAVAALLEASYLAPAPPAGVLPPPRVGPAPKTRTPPDGSSLVARNMFCSTCDPLPGGPGPTDSFVPDAVLIATSLGDEPRATVRVPASEVQGSWGIGDTIPGLGRVTSIDWVSIEIENGSGRRGRLALAGAATPKPHEPPPAASEWSDRVNKLDDHTFEVDRSLVRDLVGGTAKAGGVRILPLTGEGGKLTGLRLFGVTPASLPAALGLHNGDTLTTINNQRIESANT